jgi:hypothetical protein
MPALRLPSFTDRNGVALRSAEQLNGNPKVINDAVTAESERLRAFGIKI